MPKFGRWVVITVGVLFSLANAVAMAHGDVTPHPVDTTGLKPLGADWIQPNPYRGNEKAVAVGAVGYMHNCAGCHGLNAISGGIAPDLLKLNNDCMDMASKTQQANCLNEVDGYFKDVTLKGTKTSDGRATMPSYEAVFTQEAVWAIKAYVDSRTIEERSK